MALRNFGEIAFTPGVKALQERAGSRAAYARFEDTSAPAPVLGPRERAFIAARDSFYMASVGETGWPYVQHRGGPAGFLRQLGDHTLGFADFRGNKQYVSTGNLLHDDRVSLILVDYANRQRLKLLGHARVVESDADPELRARLEDPDYRARIERAILIDVVTFDWNCPQHTTPRFSAGEVEALTGRA